MSARGLLTEYFITGQDSVNSRVLLRTRSVISYMRSELPTHPSIFRPVSLTTMPNARCIWCNRIVTWCWKALKWQIHQAQGIIDHNSLISNDVLPLNGRAIASLADFLSRDITAVVMLNSL